MNITIEKIEKNTCFGGTYSDHEGFVLMYETGKEEEHGVWMFASNPFTNETQLQRMQLLEDALRKGYHGFCWF